MIFQHGSCSIEEFFKQSSVLLKKTTLHLIINSYLLATFENKYTLAYI